MKIFIADQCGDLARYRGKSIVIEFKNGRLLELAESESPLPTAVPEGIHIWGGRVPSQATANTKHSRLNITPVASNGIIISPCSENTGSNTGMMMFISDDGHLLPVQDKKLVIALSNGKTLEILEDYAKRGLLIWGGREPIPELSLEKLKVRTESLGIYPMAGNLVHIFPFRLE